MARSFEILNADLLKTCPPWPKQLQYMYMHDLAKRVHGVTKLAESMGDTEATSRLDGSPKAVRIAVCGLGEIASNAHLPAILRNPHKFQLAAIVDPNRNAALETLENTFSLTESDIPVYSSLSQCLLDNSAAKNLDAVAVCTPSSVTLDLAEIALQAGKHVLVEKPPGDWRRLQGLEELARDKHASFFTAYHTAACVGFQDAQEWLKMHGCQLERVQVTWKESVRKWHPGQVWVTEKNPTTNVCEGVLDMVFNPLSLLVALLGPLQFQSSSLSVPSNWETPISGHFRLAAPTNLSQSENQGKKSKSVPVTGDFAWNYEPTKPGEPEEIWTIDFHSSINSSTLSLQDGGSQVFVDGRRTTTQSTASYPLEPEYENLYQQFSKLIENQASAIDDVTPRLLEEIQSGARLTPSPAYDI